MPLAFHPVPFHNHRVGTDPVVGVVKIYFEPFVRFGILVGRKRKDAVGNDPFVLVLQEPRERAPAVVAPEPREHGDDGRTRHTITFINVLNEHSHGFLGIHSRQYFDNELLDLVFLFLKNCPQHREKILRVRHVYQVEERRQLL